MILNRHQYPQFSQDTLFDLSIFDNHMHGNVIEFGRVDVSKGGGKHCLPLAFASSTQNEAGSKKSNNPP